MTAFDRIKVPGEATTGSRDALFTQSAGPRNDSMRLHCERCDATTPVGARMAVRLALPLFLVVPWRDHPVFATCPACRRRSWLRPAV